MHAYHLCAAVMPTKAHIFFMMTRLSKPDILKDKSLFYISPNIHRGIAFPALSYQKGALHNSCKLHITADSPL